MHSSRCSVRRRARDEERRARRDSACSIHQGVQRVAERPGAADGAHGRQHALESREVCLAFSCSGFDHRLRVFLASLLLMPCLGGSHSGARGFALARRGRLRFFERQAQRLRLEVFGLEVTRNMVALGDERVDAGTFALQIDVGALALGSKGLVHFFAQAPRGLRRACSNSSRRRAADAAAASSASRRMRSVSAMTRRSASAVTSAMPACIRPCHSSRTASSSFLWRSVASAALGRQRFDLEAGALRLRREATLGVSGRISEAGLQTAVPFLAYVVEPLCPVGLGFLGELLAFDRLARCELGCLSLQIGLKTRTERVDDRTKIVIGHLRHYRDGLRASQAKSSVFGACKSNTYNDLTNRDAGRTMEGLSLERGRPRFDGDMVSQDACRGPSTSQIRWKKT